MSMMPGGPGPWIVGEGFPDVVATSFQAGDTIINSTGLFIYDGAPAAGNLLFAFTATSGEDQFGNTYAGGESITALTDLTGVFTVEDTSGNTLMSIDSMGNITGQTVSGDDVIIGGQSFTNDIYPTLSGGSVARTFIPAGDLPTGALGPETSLYELDVQLTGGRSYLIMVENQQWQLSATSQRLRINVRATTDGSTPSTSSGLFMQAYSDSSFSAFVTIPCMARMYQPAGSTLLRLLMTVQPSTTATALAWSGTGASGNFSGGQDGLVVVDLGDTVPNTGIWIGTGSGGGTPPQNYVTTWSATDTWSYEGTNADSSPNPGFTPGALINHNGNAYQGDDQLGDNGNTSTFIAWPAAVATTLSGATITKITMTLTNKHSWFSSGITVAVGKTTATPGGGSRPSITDPDLVETSMSEGGTKTFSLNAQLTAFSNALTAGNAFVLYHPGSSRSYYGYFSGGSGGANTPKITVSYTK